MVRAPYFDQNGVKRGAWSAEEDNKLRDYIQKHGHPNWRELPKLAGLSRCGKSCRLRWMNYLRPDVKHGNYSKQEEDLIINLHQQLGNKWSIIAAKLPGRTDNEVKNHWHSHLKRRIKQEQNTLELKEESSQVLESEVSLNRELEIPEIIAANPILESSTLSPDATCSSEFSFASSDSVTVSCSNWVAEDSVSGDFWTEPFVADSVYNQDVYQPSLLENGVIPYCDDNLDLYYQVMREWPRDSSEF